MKYQRLCAVLTKWNYAMLLELRRWLQMRPARSCQWRSRSPWRHVESSESKLRRSVPTRKLAFASQRDKKERKHKPRSTFATTLRFILRRSAAEATSHRIQSYAMWVSRERPEGFSDARAAKLRDTLLALDWLRWLEASATVHRKAKRST